MFRHYKNSWNPVMYCGMPRGVPVVEIFIHELESVGHWNLQSGSVCVRRFQKKRSITVWGKL